MIDYCFYAAVALKALVPDAQFKVKGRDYSGITWYPQNTEDCPSEAVLQAKIDEVVASESMRRLRVERDRLLTETDWVAARAFETGATISDEWKTYRQQLRDITKTATSLDDVTWPTQP